MKQTNAEKSIKEELERTRDKVYDMAFSKGMERATEELDKITGEAFYMGYVYEVISNMIERCGEKGSKLIFKDMLDVYKEIKKEEGN